MRTLGIALLLTMLWPSAQAAEPSPDGTLSAVLQRSADDILESLDIRNGDGAIVLHTDFTATGRWTVMRTGWSPDSRFFVFSLANADGHQPWHFPIRVYAVGRNKILAVTAAVTSPDFTVEPPDRLHFTRGQGEGIDGRPDVLRLGTLPSPSGD